MLGENGLEGSQATRSHDVSYNSDHHHGGSLNNGHSLNDLLLVFSVVFLLLLFTLFLCLVLSVHLSPSATLCSFALTLCHRGICARCTGGGGRWCHWWWWCLAPDGAREALNQVSALPPPVWPSLSLEQDTLLPACLRAATGRHFQPRPQSVLEDRAGNGRGASPQG